MDTINISKEQASTSSEESTVVSNFYLFNDLALFVFSMVFVAVTSHMLNEGSVLTFNEQLAIINKPKFSGVLVVLFGVLFAFKTLMDCISTSINGQKVSAKFSSIWVPIKFAVFCGFFIPFEQNGISTSTVVETIKWIIQLVAN
jgi:hypothetical protein